MGVHDPEEQGTDAARKYRELQTALDAAKARGASDEEMYQIHRASGMASRTEIGVMEGGSYSTPGQVSQKSTDILQNAFTRPNIVYNVQAVQPVQQSVSNEIVSGGKVQNSGTLGKTVFVGNNLSPNEVISAPVQKNISTSEQPLRTVSEPMAIVNGKQVPYSSISGKISPNQINGGAYNMTPSDIALYMGVGSLALAGAKVGVAAISPLVRVIGSDVSRVGASQAGNIYYPTLTESLAKGIVGIGGKTASSAKIIPEVITQTAFKYPLLTQAIVGTGIALGTREAAIQVQPTQAKEFIKSKKGQEITQEAEAAIAKSFEGDWLGGMVAALPIRALPEETPLIGGNVKKQREAYFGFIESKGLSEETTKAYKDVYNISAVGELSGTIAAQVGTEIKAAQIIFPSTVKLAGSKLGSLSLKEGMGLAFKEAPKFAYLIGAESLTAQAVQDVSRGKNPEPMDYATTLGVSLALGVPFGVGIYGLGLAASPIAKGIAKAAYYVGGTAGDFPETLFADPLAGIVGKAVRAPIVSITPSFTPSTSITESQSSEQKSGYDKYLQKRLVSDVLAAKGSKGQKAADALIRSFTLSSTPSPSTTVTSSLTPSFTPSPSVTSSFTFSGGIPSLTTNEPIITPPVPSETGTPSPSETGTPSPSDTGTPSPSQSNNISNSFTNLFTDTSSQSQTNTSSLSQTFSFTPTPSATPSLTARWAPFIPPFFGSGDLAGKQKKTSSSRFIDEFTLAFAGLGDLSSPVYFGKSSSIALTRKAFKPKKGKKRKGQKFKRGDLIGFNQNRFKAFLI